MAPTLENTINGGCQIKNCKRHAVSLRTAIASANSNGPDDNESAALPFAQFDLMLNRLEREFDRSKGFVDVDEIWRILEDYNSQRDDWAKFAYYDTTKYKRNLVAEYDKYNVMIITWGPGSRSCIHDHAGSHCFMKVLDGELIEGRFAWPDEGALAGAKSQEMSRVMDTRMRLNDVVYIHGEL